MGGVFGKKKQASRVTEQDKAVLVGVVSSKHNFYLLKNDLHYNLNLISATEATA